MKESLYDELIKLGVESKHLQLMKNSYPQSIVDTQFYEYQETIEGKLVDINKIVGLGMRMDCEYTWWQHFNCEGGNLDSQRINSLLTSLRTKGLNEFQESFKERKYSRELDYMYYDKIDKYVICSGGNHRTLLAKIVDAKQIYAPVEVYKYNRNLETAYEKSKENNKEFQALLHKFTNRLSIHDFEYCPDTHYVIYQDLNLFPTYFESYPCMDCNDNKLKQIKLGLQDANFKLDKIETIFNRYGSLNTFLTIIFLKTHKIFENNKEIKEIYERLIDLFKKDYKYKR
ncbi:hypothetical protein U9K47_14365 [Bacillus toyonensis]|uniref:hypothetical protein n=1 Tax=Bacillus toyonensis TaxID=155322 RepID=UPI003465E8D1